MNLADALHANRLVAIVRGSDPGAALQTVLALFDEGVQMVEVSLTTTGAESVIGKARDALGPTAMRGCGTAGSPLVGDAASGGSLAGLRQRAHLFLTAVSDQEPEAT